MCYGSHMDTDTDLHQVTIETEGSKSRAVCSCGWKGAKRIYRLDARAEGRRHDGTDK